MAALPVLMPQRRARHNAAATRLPPYAPRFLPCLTHRQTIQRVLNLYKERFVAKLPDADKAKASFARPVFLASAFYLVARKHKARLRRLWGRGFTSLGSSMHAPTPPGPKATCVNADAASAADRQVARQLPWQFCSRNAPLTCRPCLACFPVLDQGGPAVPAGDAVCEPG